MPCRSTHHSCGDARQVHSPQPALVGMCPRVLLLDALVPPRRSLELLLDKLIPFAGSVEDFEVHGLCLSAPPGISGLEHIDACDIDEVFVPFSPMVHRTGPSPCVPPVDDSGNVAIVNSRQKLEEQLAVAASLPLPLDDEFDDPDLVGLASDSVICRVWSSLQCLRRDFDFQTFIGRLRSCKGLTWRKMFTAGLSKDGVGTFAQFSQALMPRWASAGARDRLLTEYRFHDEEDPSFQTMLARSIERDLLRLTRSLCRFGQLGAPRSFCDCRDSGSALNGNLHIGHSIQPPLNFSSCLYQMPAL
jgi:hypothetical protein